MKTLINPKALLSNIIRAKEIHNNYQLLKRENNNCSLTHKIGVFAHHRDVKVAVEELQAAGFPLAEITLMARRWRSDWLRDLNICDRFEEELFGFNQTEQRFFKKLFQRGKYFLILTGKENDMNSAGAIIGRRQGHAKVWQL